MKTPLFCFLFGKNKGAWNVLERDSKSKLDRFCWIVEDVWWKLRNCETIRNDFLFIEILSFFPKFILFQITLIINNEL